MRIKTFFITLLAVSALVSCKEDEPTVVEGGLASAIEQEDGKYYFEIDGGATFYDAAANYNSGLLEDGRRVLISFIVDERNTGGYTYTGRTQYLDTVLTKLPKVYERAYPDTLQNSTWLNVPEMYVYKNYLNVNMVFAGDRGTHYVELLHSDTVAHTNDGYLNVELFHRRRGSISSGTAGVIVCFDLSELERDYPACKGVNVTWNELYGGMERNQKFDFYREGTTLGSDETMFKNTYRADVR